MYADKLSMAHSLEVRVPYLDRTVVEYVQRLGANLKVRNGSRKWLHRRVCQSYLPPGILKRKKRGFAANVVDEWFRSSVDGKLPELLLDKSSLMFELLKPRAVQKLLGAHQVEATRQPQAPVQSGLDRAMVTRSRVASRAAYVSGSARNTRGSLRILGKRDDYLRKR